MCTRVHVWGEGDNEAQHGGVSMIRCSTRQRSGDEAIKC